MLRHVEVWPFHERMVSLRFALNNCFCIHQVWCWFMAIDSAGGLADLLRWRQQLQWTRAKSRRNNLRYVALVFLSDQLLTNMRFIDHHTPNTPVAYGKSPVYEWFSIDFHLWKEIKEPSKGNRLDFPNGETSKFFHDLRLLKISFAAHLQQDQPGVQPPLFVLEERGITLDLGFSSFTTDAPEHIQVGWVELLQAMKAS